MFFSRRANANKPSCIRRVLVVEDDALVAFDHEHVLMTAGYEVVATVNSGDSAIAAMDRVSIDAVILDLNIDGSISGADVAQRAHAQGVIVLIVSADAPGLASDFAAAHLAKPLTHGALIAALRALEAKLCRNESPPRVSGLTILNRGADVPASQ